MLLSKVDKLAIMIEYLDLKMKLGRGGGLICLEIGYKGLSVEKKISTIQ